VLETLTIHAPEFDPSLTWLGAEAPLTMRALRGHVVVLDFFTSCCVNCMHVAPVLGRLEARFAGEPVVVLGVHTGKFDHEQSEDAVRAAMDRMGIRHPVLVDEGMRTWHAFGVRSWPTLVVVRPDGTLAAVAPGEPDEAALGALVQAELDRARARGHLAKEPRAYLAASPAAVEGLRYPSKIAVSPSGRVAVSDTGHARVVVWSPAGELFAVVGAGGIEARLREPQGLAFDGDDRLLVTDARAHTVVEVDLAARLARVIAGTGRMGAAPLAFEPQPACEAALRSPWDLAVDGARVFVALSGSHQLGVVDRANGTVRALAGTGAESRLDGPGREATFSQTNGLARVGDELFAADSESSSLRAVHCETGATRTLLAGSLFTWGDEDGPLATALLQHPMGLAYDGSHTLCICDTYNGKLKALDLEAGSVRTLAAGLPEVMGAAWSRAAGAWLVADARAHRIVRVSTGGLVEALPWPVPRAVPPALAEAAATEEPVGAVRFFDEVLATAPSAGPGAVTLTATLHAGGAHHFAEGAPYELTVEVSRRSDLVVPAFTAQRGRLASGEALVVAIPLAVDVPVGAPVASELVLHVRAMACRDGTAGDGEPAVCEPFTGWWRVPLVLEAGGAATVEARAARP
jgi:thiol-disulfide isomerase/thioredoxin